MTTRTIMAIWMISVMSLFCLIIGCGSDTKTPNQQAAGTTGDEKLSPDQPSNGNSNYNCSVSQAFNFQDSGGEGVVGHINYLEIGGWVIEPDTSLKNPEKPKGEMKVVVGPLSSVSWGGGFEEPISFSVRVSTKNKDIFAKLRYMDLSDTGVKFDFVVFEYDPVSKTYFRAFHSNQAILKGLILKQGGELVMGINQNQCSDVLSPVNFEAFISIMPQDIEQDIFLAVSPDGKFVKKWGFTF